MAISQWTRDRKQLQQKRTALTLLTLSGAIRKANVAPRYWGAEKIIYHQPITPADHAKETNLSLWQDDLKQAWSFIRRGGFRKGLGTKPTPRTGRLNLPRSITQIQKFMP